MSTNKPGNSPRPCVRVTRPAAVSDIGYRRPPREHQFKRGQSGNPKGRPKGAKSEATIVYELLHRKIHIREGGRTRKITVLEAILLRFTEDSLKGNVRSAAFLLNRHSMLISGEPVQPAASDDDREILRAFAERLLAQQTTKKTPP